MRERDTAIQTHSSSLQGAREVQWRELKE